MPGTQKSEESTLLISNKICVLLFFLSFLCTKHFLLTEGYFNQGAFKNVFKDLSRISRTFQRQDAFSSTFQGQCEPCNVMHLST